MPTYDIARWDAVIPKDNTFPLPMLYIKADEQFLKYAKENNYYVLLTISGTGLYDYQTTGVIDSSGYYPNYRPYFFNATKYFVITIMGDWKGYPENNGKVLLQGIEGPDAVQTPPPIPYTAPAPIEFYEGPKNLNVYQVGGISLVIAMIFIVLYAGSRR